jgi:hypothetical protein
MNKRKYNRSKGTAELALVILDEGHTKNFDPPLMLASYSPAEDCHSPSPPIHSHAELPQETVAPGFKSKPECINTCVPKTVPKT